MSKFCMSGIVKAITPLMLKKLCRILFMGHRDKPHKYFTTNCYTMIKWNFILTFRILCGIYNLSLSWLRHN